MKKARSAKNVYHSAKFETDNDTESHDAEDGIDVDLDSENEALGFKSDDDGVGEFFESEDEAPHLCSEDEESLLDGDFEDHQLDSEDDMDWIDVELEQ